MIKVIIGIIIIKIILIIVLVYCLFQINWAKAIGSFVGEVQKTSEEVKSK